MTARKVLLEVDVDLRPGRGRWWLPNRAGYTDDLSRAGLYDKGSYEGSGDREVDPGSLLYTELLRCLSRKIRLKDMLDEVKRADQELMQTLRLRGSAAPREPAT